MIRIHDYRTGPDGIFEPPKAIQHRSDDYDEGSFEGLRQMQMDHFWYRGRHRFLLHALRSTMASETPDMPWRAIDLGGGVGSWINYLLETQQASFSELALGDSSRTALQLARPVIQGASRYHIDLYDLKWAERWEAVFLLDVIEHLDDDVKAMQQVRNALAPGGYAFITTPAIKALWSYNDDLAHHKRRYAKRDYCALASESGLELMRVRYFMFFLSPLLIASRLRSPNLQKMSDTEIKAHQARTHRIPHSLVNGFLGVIFNAETPMGWWLPFPWGTSVLAVMRKPPI